MHILYNVPFFFFSVFKSTTPWQPLAHYFHGALYNVPMCTKLHTYRIHPYKDSLHVSPKTCFYFYEIFEKFYVITLSLYYFIIVPKL